MLQKKPQGTQGTLEEAKNAEKAPQPTLEMVQVRLSLLTTHNHNLIFAGIFSQVHVFLLQADFDQLTC